MGIKKEEKREREMTIQINPMSDLVWAAIICGGLIVVVMVIWVLAMNVRGGYYVEYRKRKGH